MVVISAAKPQDAPLLEKLEREVFGPWDFPLSPRALRYHIAKLDRLFVARVSGEFAGYILIFWHKKRARIYSLAVAPRFKRQGVASALLAYVKEKACATGRMALFLEVRFNNKQAIALYERQGFAVKKILHAYYPDGTDGLKMELCLL